MRYSRPVFIATYQPFYD